MDYIYNGFGIFGILGFAIGMTAFIVEILKIGGKKK